MVLLLIRPKINSSLTTSFIRKQIKYKTREWYAYLESGSISAHIDDVSHDFLYWCDQLQCLINNRYPFWGVSASHVSLLLWAEMRASVWPSRWQVRMTSGSSEDQNKGLRMFSRPLGTIFFPIFFNGLPLNTTVYSTLMVLLLNRADNVNFFVNCKLSNIALNKYVMCNKSKGTLILMEHLLQFGQQYSWQRP